MSHVMYCSEWVMSRIWLSHVTHCNKCVMSHIWMSQVTPMNRSCRAWQWKVATRGAQSSRGGAPWFCRVLQCVAVCLQWVAVCCSVMQCVALCCSVLQCVAVCYSVLQCVASCCSVLQCAAVCCSVLQCVAVCCREGHGEAIMSHIWMRHFTHMNESCHTYECDMSHIWMSRIVRVGDQVRLELWWRKTVNESCHTLLWLNRLTHKKGSSHTCE